MKIDTDEPLPQLPPLDGDEDEGDAAADDEIATDDGEGSLDDAAAGDLDVGAIEIADEGESALGDEPTPLVDDHEIDFDDDARGETDDEQIAVERIELDEIDETTDDDGGAEGTDETPESALDGEELPAIDADESGDAGDDLVVGEPLAARPETDLAWADVAWTQLPARAAHDSAPPREGSAPTVVEASGVRAFVSANEAWLARAGAAPRRIAGTLGATALAVVGADAPARVLVAIAVREARRVLVVCVRADDRAEIVAELAADDDSDEGAPDVARLAWDADGDVLWALGTFGAIGWRVSR